MKPSTASNIFQKLEHVRGWFSPEAAMFFAWIDQIQKTNGIRGDIFEIGCHHGKSTVFLGSMLDRQVETLRVCDIFDEQQSNVSRSGRGELGRFKHNMDRIIDPPIDVEIFQHDSMDLTIEEIGKSYRFFHIDGGHNVEEALSDLRLAANSIIKKGLVVLDDAFRAEWPGVTEALIRFLDERGDFRAVAVGFNKTLIAHAADCRFYSEELMDIRQRKAYGLGHPWRKKELPFHGSPLQIFHIPTSVHLTNRETRYREPLHGKRPPEHPSRAFTPVSTALKRLDLVAAVRSASRWANLLRSDNPTENTKVAHPTNPDGLPGSGKHVTKLRHIDLIQGNGSLYDSLEDAANYVQALEHRIDDHVLASATWRFLVYYPGAMGNPYQTALYSALPGHGALALPAAKLSDLLEIGRSRLIVLHLHWLGNVLGNARCETDACKNLRNFNDRLDALRERGIRLVWTVHNIIEHDAQFPEIESQVRQSVIAHADSVHVMTRHTSAQAAGVCELPDDKTFVCEHPSYEGLYPDSVQRDAARYGLGLRAGSIVFLFFGLIRRYKGVLELAEAFLRLQNETPKDVMLVIAGAPKEGEIVSRLKRHLGENHGVALHLRRIPVEEVQFFFRAADYAVCPYTSLLNSGVAILARTFGVPVIGPKMGALADMIADGEGIGYDPRAEDGLFEALSLATETAAGEFNGAITAALRRTRPLDISRRFIQALRQRLDY